MKKMSKSISRPVAMFAAGVILMAGAASRTVQAADWRAVVGAESPDREARPWLSCRMNFGSTLATAFDGPFPRTSATR
jgi:hypothetical protein